MPMTGIRVLYTRASQPHIGPFFYVEQCEKVIPASRTQARDSIQKEGNLTGWDKKRKDVGQNIFPI